MRLNELSALEALSLIQNGDVTSEALVDACLQRIGVRESSVRAWEFLDPEKALEQARAADHLKNRGLLRGIPVGVKDIMDTTDMPTAYGSPIFDSHQPAVDASVVTLIRAAGGIVLGKTVTAELAVLHPGKTANPRNLAHTPGGSSSGSAAAVADFMVPLALGTQTAGSIIRPASFCGVVGFKPTFGLINRAGIKPCAESLDTVGVFGRSVKDVAFLASILTGRSYLNVSEIQTPPCIGLCHTYEWTQAAPETIRAIEDAGAQLRECGAMVEEIELPEPFSRLAHAQLTIMIYEMVRSLAHEYYAHRDQLSNTLKEMIASGQTITPVVYDDAVAVAVECRTLLKRVFSGLDVLLAPSARGEAPEGLSSTGDPVFNRIWTLLHVPCINIPAFTGPRNLPVGIQMVSPIGADARLLAVSNWAFNHLGQKV